MDTGNKVVLDLDGLTCSLEENYAVMKINCNVFENLTDLQKDTKIFEWFDDLAHDNNVKGIVMMNTPGCMSAEAYNKFLSNITGKELDLKNPEKITGFQKSQIRAIEINMLMTFIKKMISFPKLIIACPRGEVVTPFMGLNLAADFRIISRDSKFVLSHVKYGLHPSGALPFFLPKFIGLGKAAHLLFNGGVINAEHAFDLGLVYAVYEEENYEENCLKKAKQLFSADMNVVKSTKDLLHSYKKELYKYFEQESNYLYA